MDLDAFAGLIARQEHVFTRRQVFDVGGDENLIRRMVRRREWSVVHPGVMVDHTGSLSRSEREWAAVLYYAPAALAGSSALRRHGVRTGRDGSGDDDPEIHIAVDRRRRVAELPGTRVVRVSDFDARALSNLNPPRLRLEHAVLDLAGESEQDVDAVAVMADACQSRRTTAARLLTTLEDRPTLRRRRFLRQVLLDVAQGTNSVLEWLYLHRIERPHQLPTATRQRAIVQRRGSGYRDVEYLGCAVVVELDGRVGHQRARDRWDDLGRDVDAAVDGRLTVRLGWHQVAEPCRTAAALGQILVARGWAGRPVTCAPDCQLWSPAATS